MKYVIATVSACLLFTGCASNPNAHNHLEDFTVGQRQMTRTITWRVVPDDQVEPMCQQITGGRFAKNYILACAAWRGNSCTVITGTNTDTALLGHEIRHCYDGDFHD